MHHRVRGAVLGTIAALFAPVTAAAQGDAKGASSKSVAPAEGEPAEAEPEPEIEPPVEPAPAKPVETPLTISAPRFTWVPFGFLRLQYRMIRNDPNVAFVGRDDGFELQNARLGVRGSLGNRVRYTFAIDGAVDERQQINVPEGKLRVGLRDAFADVAVGGKLAVRAGFFQTLVDPDLVPSPDADMVREFIDRPIESRGVRATEGYQEHGLAPGRSLGAALRLVPEGEGPPRIGFELAVQNGADEFASNNDNDTPAASASLLVKLPNHSYVIASGRFNRRTDGELPFRRDEDDLQGSLGARIAAGPVRVGLGAVFVRTSFPTTGGPVENAYGAHAHLLVNTGANMWLGYRFGILDPSSLFLTDRVMEHTAGATLAVPALHMRLQLQVVHVQEQGARSLVNDRAQLAAELSL